MGSQKFNDGQEIVFEDLNALQARTRKELYDRVILELVQRAKNAMFGDSFLVSRVSSTQVSVNPGNGFQEDLTVDSEQPVQRLLYRAAAVPLTITAPDGVNDRIDLVVIKHNRADGPTESRKFKNASTDVITNENLVTTEDWEADVELVDGTPAGSPSAPAVPSGYIKLAEVYVTAVTGIAVSGALTDSRTLMPLGASATINSLAFGRLTQSAALTIQQAMEEIDDLLEDGQLDTNLFSDVVSDPAAPATNLQRIMYNKGGTLFVRESNPEGGAILPVGSGAGGGGGGANWVGDALEDEEYGEKVFKFAQSDSAELQLYIKVPQGYLSGRQIQAFLGGYSPSASNEWRMQIVSSLIRKGQDAVSSTANQETNNSGDILNDQADEFRELTIDVTDVSGQINGFSVSPGDLIRLELTRIAPNDGTEDTADVRFIPSTTEVKFG